MGTNPQAFDDLGLMKSRNERNGKVRAQKKKTVLKRNMLGGQKWTVTVLMRIHKSTKREHAWAQKRTLKGWKREHGRVRKGSLEQKGTCNRGIKWNS